MHAPPVDPTGDSCENVGLNPKPNPPQTTSPTDVVNAQYRSASVTSCLSTMTPCSPPAGCRDSGYVTDGSPANILAIPFSYEQGSESPYQHLSLPSSPSMPNQLRYRYHHHHYRQQQSHPHNYHHQMGSVAHGAVGGHGPETQAPSSVSSMDDYVIYESDSQDEVDGSDDDDSDSTDNDNDSGEEEDDDVFASDSASGSFRDDHIPNYPIRGASQPIPIRNPGGSRVNRYNNNYNNNNNNNNYNLTNEESLLALDVAHPCSSYPLDDRPRHWQHLYHLRTPGSEMSPEVDHAGNVYIPCSWAPELRRTIGTQTHPTYHTNPIFNFAACRLRQQRLAATTGTSQRRLRFSEGEDPMASNRQEPLPDIVPIPRNRAQSLPEVPIRRTNIRAFGQELRRISDEYYQSHNTRTRSETNGHAFSFPGTNRINRVLDRILSLGRLNIDETRDQPPPPPP